MALGKLSGWRNQQLAGEKVNVEFLPFGYSPASKFYVPTFFNTLFHLYTTYADRTERSETSAHKIQTRENHPAVRIQH
jgi:hypothetical protein